MIPRWSDDTDDDDVPELQPVQVPTRPTPEPEPERPVEQSNWQIQGRPRHTTKQQVAVRPLLVFGSLPFDAKLFFRGIVDGETGLLDLVQKRSLRRYHGYEPVSKQLLWRLKPSDSRLGIQVASAAYVQKVETHFADEVRKIVQS